MDQGHIIFRVLHHENISITMDAGVSLFLVCMDSIRFLLHRKATPSVLLKCTPYLRSRCIALSVERMQACCRSRFRPKFCKRLTGRRGK